VVSWLTWSGTASLNRVTRSSAIAALIVSAFQRRATAGAPIRTPKAPAERT